MKKPLFHIFKNNFLRGKKNKLKKKNIFKIKSLRAPPKGVFMESKIYTPGDFSFIKENIDFKFIFEYDFKIINKIGKIAWNKIAKYDETNLKYDYIMNTINNQLYPGHSGLSYRLSLKNLKYIANLGWESFVEKYDSLVNLNN